MSIRAKKQADGGIAYTVDGPEGLGLATGAAMDLLEIVRGDTTVLVLTRLRRKIIDEALTAFAHAAALEWTEAQASNAGPAETPGDQT